MISRHRAAVVGRASAKRRREGGQKALGRDSATVAEYEALRRALWVRSFGGGCEVHRNHNGTQICHVIKRSQGGRDVLTNTFWGCAAANRAMDAAYSRGRLTMLHVVVNGVSVLDWELVRAANKFDYQLGKYEILDAGLFKV